MFARTITLAACALLAAGCANTTFPDTASLQPSSLQIIDQSHGAARVYGAGPQTEADDSDLRRKTFAGKVLAAMALKRVTGREPDPARLSEID